MTGKQLNKDSLGLLYMSVLAIAALVYGFSTIPSPTQQREIKLDHQRVSDLGQLTYSINEYYTTSQQLPKSLNDVTNNSYSSGTPLIKNDPETNKPYEYIVTSQTSYKLCATFTTDSTKEDRYTYDETNYTYSSFSDGFRHGKGYVCFIKTVPPRATAPIGSVETQINNGGKIRTMPYQIDPVKPATPPARSNQ